MTRKSLYTAAALLTALASFAARAQAVPQPQAGAANNAPVSLPRIKLCKQEDVIGSWKLKHVYETPSGPFLRSFKEFPHAYRLYDKSSQFVEVRAKEPFPTVYDLNLAYVKEATNNALQFAVGDKGVLYVYKNQQLRYDLYCGIIQEDKPPYAQGNMVVTLTKPAETLVYHIYEHPQFPPPDVKKPAGINPANSQPQPNPPAPK